MKQYIYNQIADSAATKQAILESEPLLDVIEAVAKACVAVYRNGKKNHVGR